MERYISHGLEKYLNNEHHPWHMPGHKRKPLDVPQDDAMRISVPQILDNVMTMDVTEVNGTDDLHHPTDFINDSQKQLAEVYDTFASYYLVNGSTCGILTAIAACFDAEVGKLGSADKQHTSKRKILIVENCHKSVYNAVQLLGLAPVYVRQQELVNPLVEGCVNPFEVREICENNPEIKAMVLTSPNYYGVMSDIAAISDILKEYGIKLIVDEAHGAHLPFMSDDIGAPKSAIYLGADIVVQSLHKTLPALTQTAVIHVMDESLDRAVNKYKQVFMSSSPSYVLLASMENAVVWAKETDYTEYICNLKQFRSQIGRLKNIQILSPKDVGCDITRIVLWGRADQDNMLLGGTAFEKLLDWAGGIVCEMAGYDSVVLISTPMDTAEDFDHLYKTLAKVDELLLGDANSILMTTGINIKTEASKELLETINSLVGQRAEDNIYVYPPGSYIVTRGELITKEKAYILTGYAQSGKLLRGI